MDADEFSRALEAVLMNEPGEATRAPHHWQPYMSPGLALSAPASPPAQ